jgi:hypothetical protein
METDLRPDLDSAIEEDGTVFQPTRETVRLTDFDEGRVVE